MSPPDPAQPAPAGRGTGRLRRRAALGGGLALLAAGCGVRWAPGPEVTPTLAPGADDLARAQAVRDARALVEAATALAAGGGAPAPAATAVVDEGRAHLRALGDDPGDPGDPGPVPPQDPARDAPPPQDPAVVVGALSAASARAFAATGTTGAGLARLLASIATARALQAQALAAASGLPEPPLPPVAAAPGSPVPGPGGGRAAGVEALQHALAGEHAAVYAYGLVAGRLTPERRPAALAALQAHLATRDRLESLLISAAASPTPAEPGYHVQVHTPEEALALAVTVEERLAARYADLVGTPGSLRPVGTEGLLRAAADALRWGGGRTAFPGLPELRGS